MGPVLRLAATALALQVFGLDAVTSAYADDLPADHPRNVVKGAAFVPVMPEVVLGSEQLAKDYYTGIVSPHLGLSTPADILGIKITDLLAYFGYDDVDGADLHGLGSTELMALGAPGEILAIRFFAPKITSVADKPTATPDGGFGWRKVVRFGARPGSAAAAKGMDFVYVLQNTFAPTVADDPYDAAIRISVFNQVIVTRAPGIALGPDERPAYFMTFGPLVKRDANGVPVQTGGVFESAGPLSFSLKATFDETDRDPETNLGATEYFVPNACEQCHGTRVDKVKVNYLDTDHWFDRVTPKNNLSDPKFKEDDFTAMAQSPFGVLYDGGTDVNSPAFSAAFDAIRTFNEGVKVQNESTGSSFQLESVKKWLALHATSDEHVAPIDRGFGTAPWSAANASDETLLYYFNRYCYRCHSSVKFSVFDRAAVKLRANGINSRVTDIQAASNWMPQDRIFPGLTTSGGVVAPSGDLLEFLTLLNSMP